MAFLRDVALLPLPNRSAGYVLLGWRALAVALRENTNRRSIGCPLPKESSDETSSVNADRCERNPFLACGHGGSLSRAKGMLRPTRIVRHMLRSLRHMLRSLQHLFHRLLEVLRFLSEEFMGLPHRLPVQLPRLSGLSRLLHLLPDMLYEFLSIRQCLSRKVAGVRDHVLPHLVSSFCYRKSF